MYYFRQTYCDMTPESWNSSLLDNGDEQVLEEMFLCKGEGNTPL
jgi:hypothetical protein